MRGAVSFLLLTVVAAAVAELEQNEVRELIMKLLADKRDALSMSTSNTVRESEIELVGDAEKRGLSLASCKWTYRTPGIGECSGNGECVNSIRGQNGKYDDYMCKCNDGWQGQKCDTSTSSNTDRELTMELLANGEKRGLSINSCQALYGTCSGNGECANSERGQTQGFDDYICKCNSGWQGIKCDTSSNADRELTMELLANGEKRGLSINSCQALYGTCSGNGECANSERGQTQGFDDYICKCNSGWQGIKCDTSSNAVRELIMELLAGAEKRELSVQRCKSDYGNCNGHGECVNSNQGQAQGYNDYMCRCNTGWKGEKCETSTNPVRELLMQLLADAEKRELSKMGCEERYGNCSGNGQCANSLRGQAGSYDDFICTCNIGWSGQKCDTSV